MPRLTLTAKDPSTLTADALVVAVVKTTPPGAAKGRRRGGRATRTAGPGVTILGADHLPRQLRAEVETHARALGISGAADEVRRIPTGGRISAPVLVLTGVGEAREDYPAETLRRAAGAALRELAGVESVALALPADDVEQVRAVAEGALLGAYAFTRYRDEAETSVAPPTTIQLCTPRHRDAAAKAAIARAAVIAEAVHATRDLVNTAPVDLSPADFADLAVTAAKGTGVKVTVLDEKALAEGGYGGLLAVGQGSTRPPRLVELRWAPGKAKSTVALVGKGITFDSGGLSIKPAKSMETMKLDMAGAAAVLHTVLAVARLDLPIAVTGWLCLAENMPSGTAQRPSDVITVRGGKTVEVLNTDAEGRLVLADGLARAVEDEPDAVVDIATLTGAQMVALGTRVSGVMGTDALREAVTAAAEEAGEQMWPMPLPEELAASMKSKVADIANIGDRYGGMLVGGLFLKEFVGDTPWAHLDIAGPAFNEGQPYGYTPAGGTGVGVRTLLQLLENRVGA